MYKLTFKVVSQSTFVLCFVNLRQKTFYFYVSIFNFLASM